MKEAVKKKYSLHQTELQKLNFSSIKCYGNYLY